MTTRLQIIKLYKSLVNESKKIPLYNFRSYALRKVRDTFRANQHVNDPQQINNLIKEAENSLQLIRRQALIGQMYSSEKVVIENV